MQRWHFGHFYSTQCNEALDRTCRQLQLFVLFLRVSENVAEWLQLFVADFLQKISRILVDEVFTTPSACRINAHSIQGTQSHSMLFWLQKCHKFLPLKDKGWNLQKLCMKYMQSLLWICSGFVEKYTQRLTSALSFSYTVLFLSISNKFDLFVLHLKEVFLCIVKIYIL